MKRGLTKGGGSDIIYERSFEGRAWGGAQEEKWSLKIEQRRDSTKKYEKGSGGRDTESNQISTIPKRTVKRRS